MNKATSTYLDCARFLAAFAVMLCHIDDFMVKGVFPFFAHLGVESVGVFFVLSGFVIGHATELREHDLRTYAINRAARLYSVVVPCLLLTLVLDTLGKHFLPHAYFSMETFLTEAWHIVFSFTFLNFSWVLPHAFSPGNDGPFWTLCFEVPYYVVFGLARFLRGFRRWLTPALVVLVLGPYFIVYFPIWLLGYGLFRLCRRIELRAGWGRTILVLSLLLWIGFEILLKHYNLCPNVAAVIKAGPILLYGSGLCFSLSVLGFRFSNITLRFIAKPANWLAGATFTLYLLHFPLGWFLNGWLASTPAHAWPPLLRWVLLAVATLLLTLLVAQYTERRKTAWRRVITGIFGVAEGVFGGADAKVRQH